MSETVRVVRVTETATERSDVPLAALADFEIVLAFHHPGPGDGFYCHVIHARVAPDFCEPWMEPTTCGVVVESGAAHDERQSDVAQLDMSQCVRAGEVWDYVAPATP